MSNMVMPGLGWIFLFAIVALGVSILGIYAACSEKVLMLTIFAGLMGIGMIIMMIFGIIAAVERNQFKCCRIVSAKDWHDQNPDSCECRSSRGYECTSKPQSCREFVQTEITMGFCFGFAVIAGFGA
ncbi:uncharacterized protein LOC143413266 isoform X2 [Maylandia zebra]|uniref:uncharacterized protein LOC143413266 isoform X2 n=1 Tax=Maylandia zebra TaxID=106582 RepID=UPI00403D1D4B